MTKKEAFDKFVDDARKVRTAGFILPFNEKTSCLRDLIHMGKSDLNGLTLEVFERLRRDLERRSPADSRKYQGCLDQFKSEAFLAEQVARKGAQRDARVARPVPANRNLQFTMTGGTNMTVDTPLKYVALLKDRSRQSTAILVRLPIKVHSGEAAVRHWRDNLGYNEQLFHKTVHGTPPCREVNAATATPDVLAAWTQKVNACWGTVGLNFDNRNYTLELQFVAEEDAAKCCAQICAVHTTGLAANVNPTGTIDAVRWGVNDIDSHTRGGVCHEVGHYLGCPDEYFTIGYEGQTIPWNNPYQANMGLMNNPDESPKLKHYRPIFRFVAEQILQVLPAQIASCRILPNIALGVNQHGAILLGNHIWDPETQPPQL